MAPRKENVRVRGSKMTVASSDVSALTTSLPQKLRTVPFRLCNKPPEAALEKKIAPPEAALEKKIAPPETPKKRKGRPPNVNGSNPKGRKAKQRREPGTRTSPRFSRIQKELMEKYADRPKSRSLQVGRTVELVNQKTEEWREPKGKLLFMLSLGLTPISSKPESEHSPFIKVAKADPFIVAELLIKQEIERLQNILLNRTNQRLFTASKKIPDEDPVIVVDLTSEEE